MLIPLNPAPPSCHARPRSHLDLASLGEDKKQRRLEEAIMGALNPCKLPDPSNAYKENGENGENGQNASDRNLRFLMRVGMFAAVFSDFQSLVSTEYW